MVNKFEKMILEIEKASCFSIQEWWIENGYLTIQNRAESSGENHCFQLLSLYFSLKYDILRLWNLLERNFTTYIWNCA